MCPLLTLGERWRELGTADPGVAQSLGVLFRGQSKDRRRLCPTAARKGLKSRLPWKNNLKKKKQFSQIGINYMTRNPVF